MSWTDIRSALAESDPEAKCRRVDSLGGLLDSGLGPPPPEPPPAAGRPARPERVHPAQVPRRGLGTEAGRAALLHAVAHIEFNAINLALDAALRFGSMPEPFFRDWLSVAVDEARHFRMLVGRLDEMAVRYGDLPAHNGLWDMAEKTAHDPLVRMALVPRVLEARGLDVTPGMIARLGQVGDTRSVACLETILEEEVRHVAIGTKWFRYLCGRRDLEPEATFRRLLAEHFGEGLRGPFNHAARRRAGFSESELEEIERAS